jgi:hypothetical protein
MTRHGMVQASAAGAAPPATDARAFMMTIAADRIATGRVPGRLSRAKARGDCLSAPTSALPSISRAIADFRRSSKSP